jgi:hypothetical protein
MDDFQAQVLQRLTHIETLFEAHVAIQKESQIDHESRLRVIETVTTRAAGAASVWGIVGAVGFQLIQIAWNYISGHHH